MLINGAASESIRVCIRVRPLNKRERKAGDHKGGVECLDESTIRTITKDRQTFSCSRVFNPSSSQDEVFEECGVRDLVQASIRGYNATLFAYGPTGCGKTHTTLGEASKTGFSLEGLVPRCVRDLHNVADQLRGSREIKLRVSCLEIYREVIRDLLTPEPQAREGAPNLLCREHPKYGFFVDGLVLKPCANVNNTLATVVSALRDRHTGTHQMNERSSRSHMLLTLHVDSLPLKAPSGGSAGEPPTYGSLSIVDLAGSERPKETGSRGAALREAGHINKSLYTLGKVIAGMAKPGRAGRKRNVPFRDSTLTKLLIGSLGGSSKTLMIGCISPAETALLESLRTLNFASQVCVIKNNPQVRLDPREKLIQDLRLQIDRLRDENERLYQALQESNSGMVSHALPSLTPNGQFAHSLPPEETSTPLAQTLPTLPMHQFPSSTPHQAWHDGKIEPVMPARGTGDDDNEDDEEARQERELEKLLDAQGFGPGPRSAPVPSNARPSLVPIAPAAPIEPQGAWMGPWPVEHGSSTALREMRAPPRQLTHSPSEFVVTTPKISFMPTAQKKSIPRRSQPRHGLYGQKRVQQHSADSRAAKKEEMEALVRDVQMRATRGNSFLF